MRTLQQILIMLIAMAPMHAAWSDDAIPGALPQEEVLAYVEQVIEWQRSGAVLQPANAGPRELIFQDSVAQNGLRGVRAAFRFARAQASIAPAEEIGTLDAAQQNLAQRAREVDAQSARLRQLLRTTTLPRKRAELEGQLKLVAAEQELFETVQANFNAAAGNGGTGFSAKIGNLQRGVPAMLEETPPPTSAPTVDSPAPEAQTGGILGLSGELFTIARKQSELREFIAQTMALETSGQAMLTTLRDALDALTAPPSAANRSVDARLADFKQITTVVAPLAEANVWASSTHQALVDWQQSLSGRFAMVLRQFGWRMAVLLATLAIPLALGMLAERTIDRYVTDSKRLQQAHTVRRVVVGVAVVMILLLNFISDFGSFATFAGFMTAGLAVALQGVLLSLVAHFLFYGRFGVRTGDRVTVAGVTGEIIRIGMVRFHLRELTSNAQGVFESTGKIVALPNSVLFQPSAFYKHV